MDVFQESIEQPVVVEGDLSKTKSAGAASAKAKASAAVLKKPAKSTLKKPAASPSDKASKTEVLASGWAIETIVRGPHDAKAGWSYKMWRNSAGKPFRTLAEAVANGFVPS